MRKLLVVLAVLNLCMVMAAEDFALLRSPTRTDVAVTLYVGSDRSLVSETNWVFLPEGASEVRFRWTDADIDGGSVSLIGPDDLSIGGVREPQGTSKTFAWPVLAQAAGVKPLRASYFVKSIKWRVAYELIFDPATSTASLIGSLYLTNDGQLPLRNATLELCASPAGALEKLERAREGLGDDCFASVAGLNLEPGWQRRVDFLRVGGLSARVVYRADAEAYKQAVQRFLLVDLTGLEMPGALPKGHLEVFEAVGGEMEPVARGDLTQVVDKDTEIQLGEEPNLIFKRELLSRAKRQIEFDRLGAVSGHDTVEETQAMLRSRLSLPVRLELIEHFAGKWELATDDKPVEKTETLVRWEFDLAADQERAVTMKVTRHFGSRAD